MNKTTPLICAVLLAISLILSGCVEPNIPENDTAGSTLMGDDVAPTPTPIPTPVPPRMHFSDDADAPTNDTNDSDKSTWDVCDNRHNATHMMRHGCYGGSGGGGGGGTSGPQSVVPEHATIILLSCGLLGLILFGWKH